jgi:CubicO group peptidase (beta-lactamase class C family)
MIVSYLKLKKFRQIDTFHHEKCKIIAPILLSAVLFVNGYSQTVDMTKRIDSLMVALYRRGQFNGAIIVAVAGKPIYRSSFGETNTNQKFTPTTQSGIASLSKGFTAMAIMMLAEQGKLKYDDPIIKYLPELNKFSNGITIRHLLTHTSGIPDVGDLGIDNPRLTNARALKTLVKLKSNFREPGQKYQYSNTGYLLLATVVERITGKKFSDYLSDKILDPLEMKNTILTGRAIGMGGIRSTVDDLLKWEESFYSEKLVRQSTLDEAFTPFPVKEGASTYGFGWNITTQDGDKFIWHTGNADNYRAFIGRRLSEKIAIIILTVGDSKRMEINDAIINILHGKPYTLPKMPIVDKLYDQISKEGIEKSLVFYDSLKSKDIRNYDFSEPQLNSLGYRLLSEKKRKEAIIIFNLNTTAYPESSNGFDSLGEAYYKTGDIVTAIKCYEKALELDPTNLNSMNMLKKLKK